METKIKIELTKKEWTSIGKFVSNHIGKSFEVLPLIYLIDALVKSGIDTKEMK